MKIKEFAKGIDFFFNKLIPKKLTVVVIATVIVFKKLTPPREYWWILFGYFGVNVFVKLILAFRGQDEKDSEDDR